MDSSLEIVPTGSGWPRAILAATTVLSSWLLMQVVHEGGHVLGAVLTGADVHKVILVPWELSRTDIGQSPRPLVVCWAGPLLGALIPVAALLATRLFAPTASFWFRFFAGFCLIANGAYIGFGAFSHDGDAGDLLRDGSPLWTLWLFGAITVPLGFRLWHGLGKEFGIGRTANAVHWRSAAVSCFVLVTTIAIETAFKTSNGN